MQKNLQFWLEKLCSFSKSAVKVATLGGDGNDMSFEEVFANTARHYLKDKAPSLMRYDTGFQVVERARDDSQAFGVLAFKVSGLQIFAPVFFSGGELRGHEMLYLSNQDCFVPLKDSWVQEIFRREPILLGSPIERNVPTDTPDLSHILEPPAKYARYLDPQFKPAVRGFISAAAPGRTKEGVRRLRAKTAQTINPMNWLDDAGIPGLEALHSLVTRFPRIKQGFVAAYKSGALRVVEEKTHEMLIAQNSVSRTLPWLKTAQPVDVAVLTPHDVMERNLHITEQEREQLIKAGYLVQDFRKQASEIVTMQEETYFTPDSTGFYDVLLEPGVIKKRLIVRLSAVEWRDPERRSNGCSEPLPTCLIVDLGAGRATQVHFEDVFCTHKYPDKSYTGWFRSLADKSLADFEYKSGVYLTETGASTPVFNIHCGGEGWIANGSYTSLKVVPGLPRGTRFHAYDKELRVPGTARLLAFETADCERDRPITPSQYKRTKEAACTLVKLSAFDSECSLNNQPRQSKLDTLRTLVVDYGLREKEAKECILAAEAKPHHTHKFLVKRADPARIRDLSIPLLLPHDQQHSVNIGRFSGALAPSMEKEIRSRRPQPRRRPDSDYAYEDAMTAQRAMASGQKEVFDVTMLKQLLVQSDIDVDVSKSMTKLMQAMNTVGRELFAFHWNRDQYEELYTARMLPELENSLSTVFEKLGDIILFRLRNRTQTSTSDRDAPWASLTQTQ